MWRIKLLRQCCSVSDADLVAIAEGAELCWLSVQCCWPANKHVYVSFILEITVA